MLSQAATPYESSSNVAVSSAEGAAVVGFLSLVAYFFACVLGAKHSKTRLGETREAAYTSGSGKSLAKHHVTISRHRSAGARLAACYHFITLAMSVRRAACDSRFCSVSLESRV